MPVYGAARAEGREQAGRGGGSGGECRSAPAGKPQHPPEVYAQALSKFIFTISRKRGSTPLQKAGVKGWQAGVSARAVATTTRLVEGIPLGRGSFSAREKKTHGSVTGPVLGWYTACDSGGGRYSWVMWVRMRPGLIPRAHSARGRSVAVYEGGEREVGTPRGPHQRAPPPARPARCSMSLSPRHGGPRPQKGGVGTAASRWKRERTRGPFPFLNFPPGGTQFARSPLRSTSILTADNMRRAAAASAAGRPRLIERESIPVEVEKGKCREVSIYLPKLAFSRARAPWTRSC
jgi:hypothetical protein